jgi:hypothetical protein
MRLQSLWSNPSGLPSSASFPLPASPGPGEYEVTLKGNGFQEMSAACAPLPCAASSSCRTSDCAPLSLHVRVGLAQWGMCVGAGVVSQMARSVRRECSSPSAERSSAQLRPRSLTTASCPAPVTPPPALAAQARESLVCASSLPAAHCLPLRCRFPCHLAPVLPSSWLP